MESDNDLAGYEPTRRLPTLLMEAAEKPVAPAVLQTSLAQFRQGMDDVSREFEETHARLAPAVRESCEGLAGEARQRLAVCRRALDMTHRLLSSAPGPRFAEQGRRLEESMLALEEAFATWRHAALVAQGPTALGEVNLLIQAVEHVGRGERPLKSLDMPLATESRRLRAALAEPQAPEMSAALRGMQQVVNDLLFLEENADAQEVSRLRDVLVEAAQALEAAMMAASPSDVTSVERFTVVIAGARAAVEGQGEIEPLAAEVGGLLRDLQALRAGVSSIRPMAVAAGSVDLDTAESVLGHCEQALKDLLAAVESRDRSSLEKAVEEVKRGASDMGAIQQQFAHAAENAGRTPCIRCSHYNPSDRRNCEKCGAVLPAAAQEKVHAVNMQEGGGGGEGVQMTENLQRILDAVDRFAAGELDSDAFMGEVAWLQGLVEQARSAIPEGQEGSDEDDGNTVAVYARGVGLFEEALQWFQSAATEGRAALDRGRDLLWEGAALVQEAQRRAEEATRGAASTASAEVV